MDDNMDFYEMDGQGPADFVDDTVFDTAINMATEAAFPDDTKDDAEEHTSSRRSVSSSMPINTNPHPSQDQGKPATTAPATTAPSAATHTNLANNEIEKHQARHRIPRRFRKRPKDLSQYVMDMSKHVFAASGIIVIIILCLVPDGLYVIYAYFYSYVEIYFNTRAAINVYRNSNTENAFIVFYWILALLCTIVNAFAGYGFAMIGWGIKKACRMPGCVGCVWMIPWVIAAFMIKSITLWVRLPAEAAMQNYAWIHGCDDSNVRAILSASTTMSLAETLPNVGQANFTSSDGLNCSFDLNRDESNHLRFEYRIVGCSGTVDPPYELIIYDTQNLTFSAISNSSSILDTSYTNGSYANSPLTFKSLDLVTLDENIPFLRPDYDGCWPATATLVNRNATDPSYSNVLKSLTFDPSSQQNMLVCGASGSMAGAFQISLGVVHIAHYRYSLCTTASGSASSMGDGMGNPEDGNSG